MQPYRIVKPHDDCERCTPTGDGHQLCQHGTCDRMAEVQYQRHAGPEEFASIPEGLRPIDGVATRAVFVCAAHEPPPTEVHHADCKGHAACDCPAGFDAPVNDKWVPPVEDPAAHVEALAAIHAAELAFYKDLLLRYGGDTDRAAEYVQTVFGGYLEQAKHVQAVKDHDMPPRIAATD